MENLTNTVGDVTSMKITIDGVPGEDGQDVVEGVREFILFARTDAGTWFKGLASGVFQAVAFFRLFRPLLDINKE